MVSLEFPEEKEKSHLSTSTRQGSMALIVKAVADPFLRTGQPEGRQIGWVGAAEHAEAQQEMGTEAAYPATWGACSIVWQRFSEQLVLYKAFLQ